MRGLFSAFAHLFEDKSKNRFTTSLSKVTTTVVSLLTSLFYYRLVSMTFFLQGSEVKNSLIKSSNTHWHYSLGRLTRLMLQFAKGKVFCRHDDPVKNKEKVYIQSIFICLWKIIIIEIPLAFFFPNESPLQGIALISGLVMV